MLKSSDFQTAKKDKSRPFVFMLKASDITNSNSVTNTIPAPFIVPLTHHGKADRGYSAHAPLPTVTAAHRGELAMIAPIITPYFGNKPDQVRASAECNQPLRTQTTENRFALVAAFMAQHNTMPNGGLHAGRAADAPLSTATQSGSQQQVVTSNLVKMRGTNIGHAADEPIHTLSAGGTHMAEVRAFMVKYYGNEFGGHSLDEPAGSVTTRDRFGLVTCAIDGEEYVLTDIGMRMLSPRELFRAQGFPDDYIIDPVNPATGKPLTKTAQVRMCGNSVCPPLPEALVRANLPELCEGRAAA
jgi:DNA (cytosine-5)-methyltransferase 1